MATVFIISGPSGVGKNAIERKLRQDIPSLERIVTYTTRSKRPGDVHGAEYFFVTDEQFETMKKNDEFLEWAKVHNHYYGTPRRSVESKLKQGKDILLIIDVQGALNIKKVLPEATLIFIKPERFDFLEKHILKRKAHMSPEDKQIRLATAKQEIELAEQYDYQVINKENKLDEAVEEVKKIIHRQKK